MQTITEKSVIPNEIINRKQWALSHNKAPYQTNGERASSTDVSTWTSYEDAINNSNHVGYFISEHDPYTVIDLDDCIINGVITKEAKSIVESVNSYTEISQSGTGLHIFVKGSKPGNRSKNSKKGFEMYDKERFIVTTGNHLENTPLEINENQMNIDYLYSMYFPNKETEHKEHVQQSPPMSDEEILKIAYHAKNNDKFKALMNGDISAYGSHSEADQALCNMLAFYTQDAAQIESIFLDSGLYREKSDRADYMARTIERAINDLTATYHKQDFKLHVKNSSNTDLKEVLQARRFEELERMQQEWELDGAKGRKPTMLSPLSCAIILPEYVDFILFDLEENTRVAMYQPHEGVYTRNTTLMKRVISWLEPKLNSNKADEVIYHLANNAEVREPTISRYLIPVKNGIFNLETKQLEPFSPEYVFTTKISTPYVESPFHPVIDGWDIESWLGSIACGDEEIVNLLWQVINDSLNGNYSRKKAIFLVGDGNNGKGTFQELITNLIGIKNIATLKVNEFEERFRLSVIEGKTAIIGDDVPANVYIDDSSNFNSVATGDVVSVEFKNKQPYNTAFRCSVIQSTNGMPKFRNKTQGTIRRVLIVPFNADFNGTKENFKIKDEYIKEEKVLQYVLYKAINMDFERFDIPEASKQELEIFKQDNDPVLDFKYSVFDEWKIPEVPKYLVYDFYKQFCNENGFKPLSNRQFHHQFNKHLGKEWYSDSQNRFDTEYLQMYLGDLFTFDIRSPQTPDKSYKKIVTE